MRIPLSARIALRYLFSLRGASFITIINVLSLVGITVGVAAIICVTSIFNGFREVIQTSLIDFDPHLRVALRPESDADSLRGVLVNLDGVVSAERSARSRVVLIKGEAMQVFTLLSFDPSTVGRVSGLPNRVMHGKFNLDETDGLPSILLSVGLANKMSAMPGDTLSVLSPEMIERAAATLSGPPGLPVVVAGIVQVNNRDYDNQYCFSGLDVSRRLSTKPNESIDLRLQSFEDAERMQSTIASVLPPGYLVSTWFDLHRDLYSIMQFERVVSFSVIFIIVLVAVFNILASLTMAVAQKRRDIGLLHAMGARSAMVRQVFLFQGTAIGLVAVTIGTTLGLGLCWAQENYSLFGLDRTKYIIGAVPVSVHFTDIALTVGLTLLFCTIASIYPSKRASMVIPSEALREE